MKETSFIELNKQKWKKFQLLTSTESSDPEEIADLYSDITSDLSYAQTFYEKRTVRVYLNQVAQGVHNQVHKQKKESVFKFFTVWSKSLPLELYRARKNIYFSLGLILFWTFIGVITTLSYPDFAKLILGSDYVAMTEKNITNNNPLGVYADSNQLSMFLRIAINNILVAFLMFIFGVFFTLGTHVLLFGNGVMLGTFQTFFYLKGVLATSFLGIWLHGALEMSSFVIASASGFALGNAVLFPESYTRLQSLQHGARRGIKMLLSLVPILLIAAFLESYVTHNENRLSDSVKKIIILMSFGGMLFYFFIYPLIVAARNPQLVQEAPVKTRTFSNVFKFNFVREFDSLFSDIFSFYRVYIGRIVASFLCYLLPLIIPIVILQNTRHYKLLGTEHTYDWAQQLAILMGFEVKSVADIGIGFLWILIFSIMLLLSLYHVKYQSKTRNIQQQFLFVFRKLFGTFFSMIILSLILLYVPWQLMFFVVFLLPFFWLNGAGVALGENGFLLNFGKSFSYGAKSYGKSLMTILVFGFVLFLLAQPISFVFSFHKYNYDYNTGLISSQKPYISDALDLLCDFIKDAFRNTITWYMELSNMVRQIVYLTFMFFVFPLFTISMGFLFKNIEEQSTSKGLKEQFKNFGKRKRNQESMHDYE